MTTTPPPKLVPDRPSIAVRHDMVPERLNAMADDIERGPWTVADAANGLRNLARMLAAAPPAEAPAERGDSKLVAMLRSHRDYLVQHAALFPEGSCMAAELDEMIEIAQAPRVTGGRAEEWRAVETMLRNLGQPGMADSAAGFRIIEAEAVKQRLQAATGREVENG